MGVAGVGATIFTLLTYIALSPDLLVRLRLNNTGLQSRIRDLVGYNLACLFLAVGFFMAGVPLEQDDGGAETAVLVITATPEPTTPTIPPTITPTQALDDLLELSDTISDSGTVESVTSSDSGAFGAPLQSDEDEGDSEAQPDAEQAPESTPVATDAATADPAEPTNTPAPTTTPTTTPTPLPTETATPTPTATPVPTQTRVPPVGETAVIQTGDGSTLFVRRTPGGDTLTIISDGSTVVLAEGVANWEGTVWREIRTLDGVLGWVQDEFVVRE